MRKRNTIVTAALVSSLAMVGLAGAMMGAGPGSDITTKAKAAGPAAGVQPGDLAPVFELKDTAGNTVKLDDLLKDKKALVVEWFNPGCPFIVRHHEKSTTFADLYTKYGSQNIGFVAINSGAPGNQGAGVDVNAKAKADWKIEYPILMDETGATGKAYGAKTTPHMFIILPDKKVAYAGAIDNNQSGKDLGKDYVNYASKALDSILKGESVETASTKPYGCSVKYGSAK